MKKIVAMILCPVMLLGLAAPFMTVLSHAASSDALVSAYSEVDQQQWEEIQSILSQYYGEWTDTTYPHAISNRMPFTALLGNGDIGISSNGNAQEKIFHISKGDFWEYNRSPLAAGTISLTAKGMPKEDDGNLATGYKKVTASSVLDNFTPDRAVSGKWTSGNYEGWVSDWGKKENWLKIEFEKPITFNHWIVRNSSAGRPGGNSVDTKACEIQVSENGTEWRTVSAVSDNASSVITVKMNQEVTAKWVRLLVTEPHQGTSEDAIQYPRARIVSFELYHDQSEDDGYINLTQELKVGGEVARFNKANIEKAIVDGTVVLANVDDGKGTCDYYQNLKGRGSNTIRVKVDKDTKVNFILICHGKENYGTYAQIFKDLKVNGSSEGVTYTEGRPAFEALSVPVTCTVATLDLISGENEISFEMGEDVNIAGLGFDKVKPPFNEKQDILHAEILTQQVMNGVPMKIRSWMSATNNLFVMEVTSLADTNATELLVNLKGHVGGDRPVTVDAGKDYMLVTRSSLGATEADANSYTSKVAMLTKVIGVDGKYKAADNSTAQLNFTLPAGETVYIVTAVCGGGRTYDGNRKLWEGRVDPVNEAKDLLATVSSADDVNALHNAHLDWWKDYWMQSYISLDTTDEDLAIIQKYYYAAQYEIACCVREGNVAAGLYGNWHTDDNAAWNSDYHLNYNFVTAYYGVASSNRVSMLLPAVEAIVDFMPQGMENAGSVKSLKAVDAAFVDRLIANGQVDPENGIPGGLLYPVGIGPFGMTLDPNFHKETLNTPFSAYPMIEYYNYTQDAEFMENTLYPYLKGVLTFLEHWLVEENGKYVLYAGYCESTWATNAGVEIGMYKYCLEYGIEVSEKLGVDADRRAVWQDIYNRLPEQPTVENYNGIEGNTVLARAETVYENGRFVEDTKSGIIALEVMFPGEVYGYYSSEEDLRIIQNTLDIFKGGWMDMNCFARMVSMCVNARYDSQHIVTKFADSIRNLMAANMMINDGTHGVEKVGATEAINNMLLLSDQGVIKLYGNWLADKDAKFARLRAPGAFLVSAEYDGDSREILEGATLYSEAGATATVASLWDEGMFILDGDGNIVNAVKGTAPNHEEETTYTFETKAGETYTFVKHVFTEYEQIGEGKHYKICTVDGCGYREEEDCTGEIRCTEDTYCDYCKAFISKAPGHIEVVDEMIAPTCTESGKTEGRHCSVCNEVIVAQNEIEAIGHDWADATTETPKTCKTCGATEGTAVPETTTTESENVPADTDASKKKGCSSTASLSVGLLAVILLSAVVVGKRVRKGEDE